jgi:K+-sensing histidine kinase KdpD
VVDDDNDQLIYLALGPLAALALGIVLMPLRDFTSASNLTFLFLVLTIVVAEYGGRWAAVATALVSALSLDFFLTQPYLRLEIQDKHDVLAFLGLALCGLVAAALGSRRGERIADLRAARRHQDLVSLALAELGAAGNVEHRAAKLVGACESSLPLAAVVLRDVHDHVVAAVPAERPVPGLVLQPGSLVPAGQSEHEVSPPAAAVPAAGGRIALLDGGRQVGWLDVWGSRASKGMDTRQALWDVARVAAALLAPRRAGPV